MSLLTTNCKHLVAAVIAVLVLVSAPVLSRSNDFRIIGGVETTINEVPYLVNLRRQGQFSCGGSIISHKCILTAAHCVYGVPTSSLTINAGASKLSDVGEVRQVQQTFVSPLYSQNTLDMDVAILKLAAPLSGGPSIATIPLCSKTPGDNEFVQISGWGITAETSETPSNQVRTASVQVVPRKDCLNIYDGIAYISSTMFCATVPGERDSCSGDSGGPVVYKGQVCGIVSWGYGCARQQFPGVYTNVASLRVNAFVKRIFMQNCM